MSALFEWLHAHPDLLRGAVVASAALFVLGLVTLPVLVARIPADYFAAPKPPPGRFAAHHPALRATICAVKNVLGLALFVCGLAMLVLPGQGVLTILVGLSLLSFPGKRRLELAIVRVHRVERALDWIRHRLGRPPLVVWRPAPHSDPGSKAA